MEIEKYQPLELISSWEGGVCYQAHDQEENIVDLRIFKHGYFSQERWQYLSKKLLRLYALDHPAALKIIDMELVSSPRFLAFEFCNTKPLREIDIKKWELLDRMQFATQVVDLITEAHRLGIAHNNLSIDTIRVTNENNIKVDFAHRLSMQHDTSSFLSLDEDTYSMANVLFWILSGGKEFSEGIDKEDTIENQYFAVTQFHDLFHLTSECIQQTINVQMHEFKKALQQFIAAIKNITQQMQGQKTVIIDDLADHSLFGGANAENNLNDLKKLGRFAIEKEIGSGGMGVVYLAKDTIDESTVALKVISGKCAADKNYLQRFHKEARLLAEVNNPYVANMLEINREKNIHYLVMEFIAGDNVSNLLKKHQKLSEKQALCIIADVIRALAIAHEKQIIHRDIKPANIISTKKEILTEIDNTSAQSTATKIFAKLSDFGLARHVIENESLDLTQPGAILGTPKYMSPEQCAGKEVSIRSDLYSVGATLFHFLTGHPPFEADTPFAIINKHVNSPAPSIKEYDTNVSDGLCSIVEKLLRKDPDERYQNANELLHDIENLLRGKPTKLVIHPQLPSVDDPDVLHFEFKWHLNSNVQQLWPHVSDTERVNKALGLVAPEYSYSKTSSNKRKLLARNRSKVFALEWQEHPYEWLEEKRMSVLREYNYGVFKWMASIVEFYPQQQGTLLVHKFVISPRNWFARILLNYQFKKSICKKLQLIYQRIDRVCQRTKNKQIMNAFAEDNELPTNKKILLRQLMKKSCDNTISKNTQERFALFLEKSSAQDVARIRPLALAQQLEVEPQELITLCLNAAAQGLLTLLWDMICPLCRIPSDLKDTLREMKNHGHCEACNIDYELDFANSVELIFRVHPSIRDSDLQVYCIGGPIHSPHVISQVKLRAQERMELNLQLLEGAYLLRSPQLQKPCQLHVSNNNTTYQHNIQISTLGNRELHLPLGKQCIQLINDFDDEVVIRLEHTVSRRKTLTASYVSSLPLFRKLFPSEVLSPQQLVAISNLILFAVDIDNSELFYQQKSDAEAFQQLYNYLQLLEQHVAEHSGVVIKTKNEGIIASFPEVEKAINAGIFLQRNLRKSNCELMVRVAVHRGAAMVATINNRLDYFGSTIKSLEYLLKVGNTDEVVFSQSIAEDPVFTQLINKHQLRKIVQEAKVPRTKEYIIKTPSLI
ncbi:protein kinase domain-containing protein [Candidatus Uabimicrobium amorphum]|uniref:non-specific serine/threonine protein kinase n=1 Tax=Uabimicrobium amorphum TaxID=2596890 RepID=A0A5S9IQL7_UABAM|nr:protein kinase [Candidatus Uabimicrobium amorphum]BBM84885.1 serine/threonine protein kinase [Candidatus Uabimicrobium amorphum]